MSSAIPVAMAALQSALSTALPNAVVVLGQEVGLSVSGATQTLYIGGSGSDDSGWVQAGTGALTWAQLGGKFRDERFTVEMAAYASNGQSDVQQAMQDAIALYDAVGAYVVGDPTLGGSVLTTVRPSPNFDLKWLQEDAGAAALLTFSLEWHARI